MTLRDILKVYNFRQYINEKPDTQLIRIIDEYSEGRSMWFEFGVDDWAYDNERDYFVENILQKKLLDREVSSVTLDEITEIVHIDLDDPNIKETPKK